MKSIKVVSFALAVLFITLAICLCSCSSSNTMDGNYKVTYVKKFEDAPFENFEKYQEGYKLWDLEIKGNEAYLSYADDSESTEIMTINTETNTMSGDTTIHYTYENNTLVLTSDEFTSFYAIMYEKV